MQMHYGNYQDFIRTGSINHPVGETVNTAAPRISCELRPGVREILDPSYCVFNLCNKIISEFLTDTIVIRNCIY